MTNFSGPSVPSHPYLAPAVPSSIPHQLSPLLVGAFLLCHMASDALFVLAAENPGAWSPNWDAGQVG